jgi:rhodanese-related sulfurtransferase
MPQGNVVNNDENAFGQVTVDEAIELYSGDCVLVDVREQYEWDAGHAPDALLMPMSELQSRFTELPAQYTLLVICHTGYRSLIASRALAEAGFTARNVVGGMSAWARAGGPLVAEDAASPSA